MKRGLGNLPAKKRTWAAAIVTLMLASGLLVFMLRPGAAKLTTQSLSIATAKKGEFLVIISCRGELVAGKSMQITAPVNVPNLQIVWMVDPGSAVKPGDPLIRAHRGKIDCDRIAGRGHPRGYCPAYQMA